MWGDYITTYIQWDDAPKKWWHLIDLEKNILPETRSLHLEKS